MYLYFLLEILETNYEPHHKERHLVTCIPSENLQHAHDVTLMM